MYFIMLIFSICSVGYAFINFEDVSRRPKESTSTTLTVEQPYSIIDVSDLSNYDQDKEAHMPLVCEG